MTNKKTHKKQERHTTSKILQSIIEILQDYIKEVTGKPIYLHSHTIKQHLGVQLHKNLLASTKEVLEAC